MQTQLILKMCNRVAECYKCRVENTIKWLPGANFSLTPLEGTSDFQTLISHHRPMGKN